MVICGKINRIVILDENTKFLRKACEYPLRKGGFSMKKIRNYRLWQRWGAMVLAVLMVLSNVPVRGLAEKAGSSTPLM